MKRLVALLVLSSWCVGGAPSPQGIVHVVDAAAGPGADFTSIRVAAQSAASGDVLLIRGGSYDESALVFGKSLTLQAEAGANVFLNEGLRILSTTPGQVVAVRGLFVSNQGSLGGRPLSVSSCQGPVLLEDSSFQENHLSFNSGTSLSDSASVVFTRCTLDAPVGQPNFPLGTPTTLEVNNSHVTLLSTRVEGFRGPSTPIGTPGAGSLAVHLSGSTLVASNSTIVGGVGGDYVGAPGTCTSGGPGGDGLRLASASSATLFGGALLGGPGGATTGACSPGASGAPLDLEPGSTVLQDPRDLGRLDVTSPVRELASLTLTARAEPGALAWALYAGTAVPGSASPAFAGVLLVATQPFLFEFLGALPATGTQAATLQLGLLAPGVLGMPLHAQLMTLSPTDGRLRLGDTTLLTWIDASL